MVYLTVLSVCMIVTVIGIGALLVVREQRLTANALDDASDARVAARSGIEMARYLIVSDPNWRTTHTSGTWQSYSFRNRQCSIAVTDPVDGNLSNCLSDPVLVTSTGTSGSATQILQATLAADRKPLTCLATVLAVNGTLNVQSGGISTDQLISVNGSVVTTANIDSNIEAPGLTVALGSGSRTSLATPRVYPASTAFDYYITFGTPIDINTIPISGVNHKVKNVTLSATANPYGQPNAQGIYVIDCGGQKLQIQDSTITATIVLLNADPASSTGGALAWSAPGSNMPALMVRGPWTFGQNAYPSFIKGLCYFSGDLSVTTSCTVNGQVIVGGNLNITNPLILSYDGTPYSNPPQGFYQLPVNMKPVAGNWKPATN